MERTDSAAPAAVIARIDTVEMLLDDALSPRSDAGLADGGGGKREGRTGFTAAMTFSTMRRV